MLADQSVEIQNKAIWSARLLRFHSGWTLMHHVEEPRLPQRHGHGAWLLLVGTLCSVLTMIFKRFDGTGWVSSGALTGWQLTEFLKHCFYCHCQLITLFSAALKWPKTKEPDDYTQFIQHNCTSTVCFLNCMNCWFHELIKFVKGQ